MLFYKLLGCRTRSHWTICTRDFYFPAPLFSLSNEKLLLDLCIDITYTCTYFFQGPVKVTRHRGKSRSQQDRPWGRATFLRSALGPRPVVLTHENWNYFFLELGVLWPSENQAVAGGKALFYMTIRISPLIFFLFVSWAPGIRAVRDENLHMMMRQCSKRFGCTKFVIWFIL